MNIKFSKYFTKQYHKLPKSIQEKFKKRLAIFIEDNSNRVLNIHGLKGNYTEKYSFNVDSDYRVIFEKLDEGFAVLINIGTHSNLYK